MKPEEAILAHIREKCGDYFPDEDFSKAEADLVPAPFRTTNPVYVVEVRSASGRAPKKIIAKVTPDDEATHGGRPEYEMLKLLYGHPLMTSKGFHVPKPIDFLPSQKTLLLEIIEGEKLGAMIKRQNSITASTENIQRLGSLLRRCGECLRAIHDITANGTAKGVPDDLRIKVRASVVKLTSDGLLSDSSSAEIHSLTDRALELTKDKEFRISKQHGDFHPGNVIVQKDGIAVIDFTFAEENVIYNDIGQFLLSLETIIPYPRNFLFAFGRLKVLQRRFLEGYFGESASPGEDEWLLLHLFKLRNALIRLNVRRHTYKNPQRSVFIFMMKRSIQKEIDRIKQLIGQYA
ncbi:MAG: hypothetical protein EPN22_10400 [Nitrospirae bacterium]|nr:MAG: hypothetical protein EPN22_10400 [Nitrospirota bacterium]